MSRCRICGEPGRFYRDEPSGYVAWHEWAEKMGRTHEQHPCSSCARLTVWRKRGGGGGAKCPNSRCNGGWVAYEPNESGGAPPIACRHEDCPHGGGA